MENKVLAEAKRKIPKKYLKKLVVPEGLDQLERVDWVLRQCYLEFNQIMRKQSRYKDIKAPHWMLIFAIYFWEWLILTSPPEKARKLIPEMEKGLRDLRFYLPGQSPGGR